MFVVNALVAAVTRQRGAAMAAWHKKWNTIMVAIAKSWHQIAPLLGKIIGPVFLLDKAEFAPGRFEGLLR